MYPSRKTASPSTPHSRRRIAARRHPFRVFLLVLVIYVAAASGIDAVIGTPGSRAQTPAGGRSGVAYLVTGDGSRLREVDGEMVLEFPNGIRIEHDDIVATALRGIHRDARMITQLTGDVKIVQGTMTMWGDDGEYRRLDDLAIMRRNVRIVDEGWEVTCDEARFDRSSESGWLIGNIVARDSATTLYADSLFYDRNSSMTEAFGNVRVTNLDEGFAAEGKHGYYFRDSGYGVFDRDPHLIVEPDSDEPVTIDSDTMRVYPDEKHAIAYYRVKILKGSTVTQCDSAVLYDEENRAELYGNPLAMQDRVSMKGQTMVMHYDEEEVNRIDINGSAEMRELQADSLVIGRDNWIRGDTISLYLHENRVDSIRVLDNAVSEYFPATPSKTESNFVRGDSMFFQFEGDSLDFVRIRGKADGVYKFLDLSDSETSDSLRAAYDTTLTFVSFRDKAQKVVYSATNIEYRARTKDLMLSKPAKVNYQGRVLTGDAITYFSSMQLVDARGEPKLVDQGQEFYGDRMVYDLEADAGLVNKGSTKFDPGYYDGENVAKVGDNEMKVWNSRYTTCEFLHPHFHIKAKHMKVYPRDKAVSGSTILYIGETPVFYLPFIANSIRRGRRSGFLRPDFEFGITSSSGRYIRNVGYFWALNDYTDFKFVFDFNEDRQTRLFARNRYNVRYKFDGEVTGGFLRDLTDYTNQWEINARHNHNLGEKFSLRTSLRFLSDDDALKDINRIDDVENVVDREIRSTLVVAKSWDVVSLNLSADRMQKLNVTDPAVVRIRSTLPKLTLSIPQRDLYFGERNRDAARGFWEKLLTGVKYSPGFNAQRNTNEWEFVASETITSTQSLNFQSPQKIGFLNLSPTLTSSNKWTRTVVDTSAYTFVNAIGDTTFFDANRIEETENEFRWGLGANASTNIYGTFYPRIGRLRGIRHLLQPAASYSFRPEIGSNPRSQSLSVRLTNTFDLKMVRKALGGGPAGGGNELVTRTPGSQSAAEAARLPDLQAQLAPTGPEAVEGGEEDLQKISGFLIWALSSSYNPEAKKNEGWSDIRSSVNLRALGTNISMNQTFDPYEQKLLSTSLQTGFTLRGSHPFGRSDKITVEELNIVAASDTTGGSGRDANAERFSTGGEEFSQPVPGDLALKEGRMPWSLRMAVSYNNSLNSDPRATVDLAGEFDLTKNWRFTYWTSYDLEAREMDGQNFGIHRDLHCWEMSLSRQLLGDEWQFYFRIAIKAHPELYGETGQRGLGGFASGITSGSTFTNY